jgi:hypothetical protein
MTTPDLFLFVSHVSEDRSAASEIVAELERRGVGCWIAPRDVRPGRPFDDEIADAIDASRAMLLIFSERCNDSEYIRREVTVAGESHKVIIPFRIEDAQPRRGLRVRLLDLHWIDGFVSRERAVDELVNTFHPSEGGKALNAIVDQALPEQAGMIERSGAGEGRRRHAVEVWQQRGEGHHLHIEADAKGQAEEDKRYQLRHSEARPSRPLPWPSLLIGSLFGVAVLGAIGVWLVEVKPKPVSAAKESGSVALAPTNVAPTPTSGAPIPLAVAPVAPTPTSQVAALPPPAPAATDPHTNSAFELAIAECSAKYKAAKNAGTLNGMRWNDFRKAQCGSDATAAPAVTPAPAAASAPATAPAP